MAHAVLIEVVAGLEVHGRWQLTMGRKEENGGLVKSVSRLR
jgi:hypothetical protein